ncbi:MAG: sigma-70 family RNA polymerase sigma factor [Chloroflexi bacterium]|nr:sigma-70 family RNA polymerase sigma factor [Chloroflexota bacterium]
MTGRVGVASIDVARRAAFARLVDAQLDASYRIAGVILGSGGDAEDAAHDAVVRAWRSCGTLRDAAKFEAWFQRDGLGPLPRIWWTQRGTAIYWLDGRGGHIVEVASGRTVDLPAAVIGCDDLQRQPLPG